MSEAFTPSEVTDKNENNTNYDELATAYSPDNYSQDEQDHLNKVFNADIVREDISQDTKHQMLEIQDEIKQAVASVEVDKDADTTIYEVQSGDYLSKIAQNYDGVSWQQIAKLNDIAAPYVIQIDQKLQIPSNQGVAKQELIVENKISAEEQSMMNGMNTAMTESIKNKDMQPVINYVDNISDADWKKYVNNPKEIAEAKVLFNKFSNIDMSQLDASLHDGVDVMKNMYHALEDNNITKTEIKDMYVGVGKVLEGIPDASYEMFMRFMSENTDAFPKLEKTSEVASDFLETSDVEQQLLDFSFDSSIGENDVTIDLRKRGDSYTAYIDTPSKDGWDDSLGRKIRIKGLDLSTMTQDDVDNLKQDLEDKYNSKPGVIAKRKDAEYNTSYAAKLKRGLDNTKDRLSKTINNTVSGKKIEKNKDNA